MMHKDQTLRYTAEQALQNKWIKKYVNLTYDQSKDYLIVEKKMGNKNQMSAASFNLDKQKSIQ